MTYVTVLVFSIDSLTREASSERKGDFLLELTFCSRQKFAFEKDKRERKIDRGEKVGETERREREFGEIKVRQNERGHRGTCT